MNNQQLSKPLATSYLNKEDSGRRKNQKHQKFYAIFVDKELINEKKGFKGLEVMHETLAAFSAFVEEAIEQQCRVFFSERKQRWVFWKSRPWILGAGLHDSGVRLTTISNRNADYQTLVKMMGADYGSS
jgi:hypothetical protein